MDILYKDFIKSVRKYSVHNTKRTLMISTYGAQLHEKALRYFRLPKDNNIIVDVHFYSKSNDANYYKEKFKNIKTRLIDNHIPVILGECGIKKPYIDDLTILSTYLHIAKQYNIKCVLWDNGSSRKFINRQSAEIINTEFIEYLSLNN